jgi:UDP-N-acetylglucosamine transferase subunit ALG13
MIYVTLGTMFLGFDRLVAAVDAIAESTGEQVIVQLGNASSPPGHCEWFEFLPREECLEIQRHARVIVGHAGIGTAIDALSMQRPFIVVPRLKRFNEHMNDHQLEIAEAVERRGWGRMVLDMEDLADACAHPPEVPQGYSPNKAPLIAAVKAMIERVAREASPPDP